MVFEGVRGSAWRYHLKMANQVGSMTMDLTGWLSEMQMEMDGYLANLAQVCVAAETKSYADNLAAMQFGITRLILEHAKELGEKAPELEARSCFLNAIGKFISFLDKLIASQRLAKEGIPITKNVSVNELQNYVNEYIAALIEKVAKNTALKNPDKIACFPGVSPEIRDTALEYFGLRRTLEHHQDKPEKLLTVHIHRVALMVNDVEIKAIPFQIKPGEVLGAQIAREQRQYSQGSKITLSPKDAHDLVFTMRNVLAPEIFRAHLAAGSQAASAPNHSGKGSATSQDQ
jgi:hypothetical protein